MLLKLLLLLLIIPTVDGKYIVRTTNPDDLTNRTDTFMVGDVFGYFSDNPIAPNNHLIEDDHDVQTQEEWNLDRLDQTNLPLDFNKYTIDSGSNVDIFVLDTGVRGTHQELIGNVQDVPNFAYPGYPPNDIVAHGTHVSSIAIGRYLGVARKAKIFNVKVLNDSGTGTYSSIIKAIEWILKNKSKTRCSIVNMSLGGPFNSIFNDVVNSAVELGLRIVVAGGNSNRNACLQSPASAEKAITVGSTDSQDYKSYFSNIGSCIDLFAPGSNINGAISSGNHMYRKMSGSSMSAPHVSGALAVYLSTYGCNATTDNFLSLMKNNKIKGLSNDSPNKLVNVMFQKCNGLKKRKKCRKNPNCKWKSRKCLLK